jgi:hypothetical protein
MLHILPGMAGEAEEGGGCWRQDSAGGVFGCVGQHRDIQ